MTDQKKLEIRFLVRTTISYIRRGPFPSLACDFNSRRRSSSYITQARPPGPALADAPEAHRRVGWAPPDLRYVTKKEISSEGAAPSS